MARGSALARVSTLACALIATWGTLQGSGLGPFPGLAGDPPTWATSTLSWLFLANLAIAIAWRGLTPGVAPGLVAVGVPTMLSTLLLATFSSGIRPPPALGATGLLALFVAAVGVMTVDLSRVRATVTEHSHVLATTALIVAAFEPVASTIATSISLLPVLWASGAGIGLAPLAVLAGVRWLETTGIRVDRRLGVRLSDVGAGYRWARRRVVHFDKRPDHVHAGFVTVAIAGAVLLLLAPIFGDLAAHSPGSFACTATWGPLEYEAAWRAFAIEWHDGCRTYTVAAHPVLVPAGFTLWAIGLTGDVLARFDRRLAAVVPAR